MRKSLTGLTCLLLVSQSFAKLEDVGSYDNGLLREVESYKKAREQKMEIINKRVQIELKGLDQKALSEMLSVKSSDVEGSKDGPVVERIKSWPIDDKQKSDLIDQVKQMSQKIEKEWSSTVEIKDDAKDKAELEKKNAEIEKKNAEILKQYSEFVIPPAPSEKMIDGLKIKMMSESVSLDSDKKVKDVYEFEELRELGKNHDYKALNTFKPFENGSKRYGIENFKDGDSKVKMNLGNGQTRIIDFGTGKDGVIDAKIFFEAMKDQNAFYTNDFEMLFPAVGPLNKFLKQDITEQTELSKMSEGGDPSVQTVKFADVIIDVKGEDDKSQKMSLEAYMKSLRSKSYLKNSAVKADEERRRNDKQLKEHLERLVKIKERIEEQEKGKSKLKSQVLEDIIKEGEKRIEIANQNREHMDSDKQKIVDETQQTINRYREAAAAAAAK